jgi:carbon-monoxide dehydrogenase medium subunit
LTFYIFFLIIKINDEFYKSEVGILMLDHFDDLHWRKEIPIKHYLQPQTLGEALEILVKNQGRAQVVAGGTDVVPQLRRRELQVDVLVDITRISGMESIRVEGDTICIGALVTHAQVCSSQLLKERALVLTEGAGVLGSPQIRNIATVAGNLISGQPAADTSIPLLALNARVKIFSEKGGREVLLPEFFLDQGRTAIDSRKEILTQIRFPALQENQGGCYLRLSKRKALSLPILALATVVDIDPQNKMFKDVALAIGPVAPIPFRVTGAEAMLRGTSISKKTIEVAAEKASLESSPRSSFLRGSSDYRKEMVRVLVRRSLIQALTRIGVFLS